MRLLLSLTMVLLCGCRTAPLPNPPDGGDGGGYCPLDGGGETAADPGVRCGATLCRPPAICCSNDFGHGGSCLPPASCFADNRFACDDAADCGAGSECCYSPDHGSRCVRSGLCACHAAWLVLCAGGADCAVDQNCCPRSAAQDPPAFLYCTGNRCTP